LTGDNQHLFLWQIFHTLTIVSLRKILTDLFSSAILTKFTVSLLVLFANFSTSQNWEKETLAVTMMHLKTTLRNLFTQIPDSN
jgi:hypothetical protein